MRVLLVGITGRMGREIVLAAEKESGAEIVAGVGRSQNDLKQKIFGKIGDAQGSFDVVIDFSLPELFDEVCDECMARKVPLVSGTTGLTGSNLAKLHETGKKIPVLWGPNMSLGIAWLNHTLKSLAGLQGFDFQIHDIHHNKKKDRPSGTAVLLQKTLEEALQKPLPEVHATRAGGVFGVHQVYAVSDEEQILLEHTALNRAVFARGALRAARWIQGKPAGLYHMADVLGLK